MSLDDFKREIKSWRSWVVIGAFIIPTYLSLDAGMDAKEANEIAKKANEIAKKAYQLQQMDYNGKSEFILGASYNHEKRELTLKSLTENTDLISATIELPGEIKSYPFHVTEMLSTVDVENYIINNIGGSQASYKELNFPDDENVKGLKVNGGIPTIINVNYEALGKELKRQNLYIIEYAGILTREGNFTIDHLSFLKGVDLGTSKYSEEFLMSELEAYLIKDVDVIY